MNDLISRQAAIAEFSCCELTPDGGIDANYALDFLEQMPSAPQWIPCSRLPEKDGYYLVSEDNGDIEIEWYDNSFKEWGYFGVIAWMPLPSPYQEGADNDRA